jgi:dCMP deaminase
MTPAKQRSYDIAYLKMAREWAKLSYCKRKQVGALIVKDKMIISDGYNGTPSGFENICEDEEGLTKWYVLHAEANAITKVAHSTQSAEGATLYITLSPCRECSKLILQTGIKRVVFCRAYRDSSGVDFLRNTGIEVIFIDQETF